MPRWLASIVDVRPGEIRRVGGMFVLLGLIIATSYILKPVRSSLFLSEFGSEQLPYVYILVALVLGVVAAGFAKWVPRQNLPRNFRLPGSSSATATKTRSVSTPPRRSMRTRPSRGRLRRARRTLSQWAPSSSLFCH